MDFSKDLFPQLLENNIPIYGYIADGYWCDIGNLEAYREAQYAALEGQVYLEKAYASIHSVREEFTARRFFEKPFNSTVLVCNNYPKFDRIINPF